MGAMKGGAAKAMSKSEIAKSIAEEFELKERGREDRLEPRGDCRQGGQDHRQVHLPGPLHGQDPQEERLRLPLCTSRVSIVRRPTAELTFRGHSIWLRLLSLYISRSMVGCPAEK